MISLYEETYAWKFKKQVQQDRIDNPKLKAPIVKKFSSEDAARFGAMNRLPKKELTKQAKKINEMMCLGLKRWQIAKIMEKSEDCIRKTEKRYNLPLK